MTGLRTDPLTPLPDIDELTSVFASGMSGDVAPLVAFLDRVHALDAVQGYKDRTFALMAGSGTRVCDVGCGTGDDVATLRHWLRASCEIVGVDANPALIGEAQHRHRHLAGVEFRVADAHALPFPDGSFDAVRSDRVLQHVEDPAAVVAELVRVTRSGGTVVLADTDWDTLVVDVGDRALELAATRALAGRSRHPGVGRTLPRLLREAGAPVLTIEPRLVATSDRRLADALLGLSQPGDPNLETAWRAAVNAADIKGTFLAALGIVLAAGERA
jgi:SAM-dependent methyltransferase